MSYNTSSRQLPMIFQMLRSTPDIQSQILLLRRPYLITLPPLNLLLHELRTQTGKNNSYELFTDFNKLLTPRTQQRMRIKTLLTLTMLLPLPHRVPPQLLFLKLSWDVMCMTSCTNFISYPSQFLKSFATCVMSSSGSSPMKA